MDLLYTTIDTKTNRFEIWADFDFPLTPEYASWPQANKDKFKSGEWKVYKIKRFSILHPEVGSFHLYASKVVTGIVARSPDEALRVFRSRRGIRSFKGLI